MTAHRRRRARAFALTAAVVFCGGAVALIACGVDLGGEGAVPAEAGVGDAPDTDGSAGGEAGADAGGVDASSDTAAGDGPVFDAAGCATDPCIVRVVAGGAHTCALDTNGHVWCWGNDDEGELLIADAGGPHPVEVPLPANAVTLAAGGHDGTTGNNDSQGFTCATLASGAATCWGDDSKGELGQGVDAGPPDASPPVDDAGDDAEADAAADATPPPPPPSLDGASSYGLGWRHGCAVVDGQLLCWGVNTEGELGRGGGVTPGDPTPEPVVLDASVAEVAGGYDQTCAITTASKVLCWGNGKTGALGFPSAANVTLPSDAFAKPSDHVAAGTFFTCASTADAGVVTCWGDNTYHQCGADPMNANFNAAPTKVPVALDGGAGAIQSLAAGRYHACVVTHRGDVYCWGGNYSGEVGVAGGKLHLLPTRVPMPGNARATSIAAGTGHTCAVLEDGHVACWGSNASGQLGSADAGTGNVPVPVLVVFP